MPCPADVLMYVVATGEQWNSHMVPDRVHLKVGVLELEWPFHSNRDTQLE